MHLILTPRALLAPILALALAPAAMGQSSGTSTSERDKLGQTTFKFLAISPDARAATFHALRRDFPRRRAWGHYALARHRVPQALHEAVALGLGLTLV